MSCYFLLSGGKIIQREVPLDALKQDGNFFYAYKEDKPFTGIGFSEFANGQKDTVTRFNMGKQDGLSEIWWENGNKKLSLNFLKGQLHGLNKAWHQNGKKLSEGTMLGGEKEGRWEYWDDNGTKRKSEIFLKGKREGEYAEWHANGKLFEKGNFENDKMSGNWKAWHSDGELKREGQFINGLKHGLHLRFRDPILTKKVEETWGNGNLIKEKTWLATGNIVEGQFLNAKQHGEWITFDKDGIQMWSDSYENGIQKSDGLSILIRRKEALRKIIEGETDFKLFIEHEDILFLNKYTDDPQLGTYQEIDEIFKQHEFDLNNLRKNKYDDSICYKQIDFVDGLIERNKYLKEKYPLFIKNLLSYMLRK